MSSVYLKKNVAFALKKKKRIRLTKPRDTELRKNWLGVRIFYETIPYQALFNYVKKKMNKTLHIGA